MNSGTTNIIADKSNTTFTGNTDNTGSNAICNYRGTVNLNAGEAKIVFNDGIDGYDSSIANNIINNTGVKMADVTNAAPTTGTVEINNEVKNKTVNMYNGTLLLGTNTQNGTLYSGTFADSVDFNYNGGTNPGYDSFNPSVMASPVAAQLGGYLVQLNSYDEAFRNMDMYMLMTKNNVRQ